MVCPCLPSGGRCGSSVGLGGDTLRNLLIGADSRLRIHRVIGLTGLADLPMIQFSVVDGLPLLHLRGGCRRRGLRGHDPSGVCWLAPMAVLRMHRVYSAERSGRFAASIPSRRSDPASSAAGRGEVSACSQRMHAVLVHPAHAALHTPSPGCPPFCIILLYCCSGG